MQVIRGKSVFAAIAVGRISVYQKTDMELVKKSIMDCKQEHVRFERAREATLAQLATLYGKTYEEVGEKEAQIFTVHQMLIKDEAYTKSIRDIIETEQSDAIYAVEMTARHFEDIFSAMDEEYMRDRGADVRDVSNRLIYNLKFPVTGEGENLRIANRNAGVQDASIKDEADQIAADQDVTGDEGLIIWADELTPGELMSFGRKQIAGIVTTRGSIYSHTAILARAMQIPTVVGVEEKLAYPDGHIAAVDGFSGEVYLDPDEEILKKLAQKQQEEEQKKIVLQELKGKEKSNTDECTISICANISSPQELPEVLANHADGIGLYRSEFLYLQQGSFPDEEAQFAVYKKILETMAEKRVVIRTMDIRDDKQIGDLYFGKEEFRIQLRALLRASVYGKLGIMFPMIRTLEEVQAIKKILDDVKVEFDEVDVEYTKDIEIGVMIETPEATNLSDQLALEVNFFSVGTNDLMQYTLGLDRQQAQEISVDERDYEPVFRLIECVVQAAHKHGKRVGICGEFAADKKFTKRWIEMGIDELSMSPTYISDVRNIVRTIK